MIAYTIKTNAQKPSFKNINRIIHIKQIYLFPFNLWDLPAFNAIQYFLQLLSNSMHRTHKTLAFAVCIAHWHL